MMRFFVFSATVLTSILLSFAFLHAQGPTRNPDYVPARIISTPPLTPPQEVIDSGLGGVVDVEVSIDKDGNVTSAKEGRGPDGVCRQILRADVVAMRNAARDTALLAKFSPARRKGKPVESIAILNFNFPGTQHRTELISAPASQEIKPRKSEDKSSVPKRINGGVLNGKALSLSKPSYPSAAHAVRAQGAVSIQVLIDEEGNVFSAEPVSGHPLLRLASTEAACRSKFSPTRLDGDPVKVSGVIVYNFVP